MVSRMKDRIRDSKKLFKENWKLFSQSKLGLIGLGIIIFFVLMAVLAPVIPYANDRDPVMWYAPDKDLVQAQYLWLNATGSHIVNNKFNATTIYPIYDKPVGILSDGSDLETHIELGDYPGSEYLEAIYLSTGDVGKGVYDISPKNGMHVLPSQNPITYTQVQNHSIGEVIPDNMGPVTSSVKIYHSPVQIGATVPREAVVVATSETGNVVGIKAKIIGYTASGSGETLLPISYERLWRYHMDGNISDSASVFYGNMTNSSDDEILAITDNGTLSALSPLGNSGSPVVLWSKNLNGTGFYSPITVDVDNMVIAASRDGHFYGLNASDGSLLWNSTFDVEFSTPYLSNYFAVNHNDDALVYAGTSDGYVYGIRIHDQNASAKNPKKAGEREKYIYLGQHSQVPDILVTPDAPNTQNIYASVTYTEGGMYYSDIYCIRAKDIQVEENPFVWKNTKLPGNITQKPGYFSQQGISYCVTERGTLYAFTNQGTVFWKSTIKEGAYLFAPLVAPNIPHSADEKMFVYKTLIMASKSGDMAALSTNGKYLAPLPPGVYPSGNRYLLGTDAMGRDIFSQLVWGSRIALIVGFAASFLSVLTGVLVGVVAGYSGGWVDTILMRFTDVILVMPFLPLIIVFTSLMGPSIWNIILAITLVGWPGTARIIRSQVLSLKERPFIDAAKVTGASNTRIMFRHIVPNVLPLAFLYMTFAVTGAILGEASLSFIGLGDPTTMSWGMMLYGISHGSGYTLTAWWWLLPPGFAITFLVLGFFLVGRAFEEIINPRLRARR